MGDLVAPGLALTSGTAQALKPLAEERLHVVRLKPACFGSHHVLADALHATRVHGVVRQGTLFHQVPESVSVERVVDRGLQAGPNLRLLPVPNRLDHELAQWSPLEVELAEHVEHLPAE